MSTDGIKDLVERLRGAHKLDIVDFDLYLNAADALTLLSDQLLAKTELANLYAASLRQSEAEVEGLKVDAERYRWLREGEEDVFCVWGSNGSWGECGHIEIYGDALDERIDAARSQIDKEKL
jgi:hypothetical protein